MWHAEMTSQMCAASAAADLLCDGQGPRTRGIPEQQLTDAGASKPVPLTATERARVDAYTQERNQSLKQSQESDLRSLRSNERADVETARAAIRVHMSRDDLAGAIKEERNVVIEHGVSRSIT